MQPLEYRQQPPKELQRELMRLRGEIQSRIMEQRARLQTEIGEVLTETQQEQWQRMFDRFQERWLPLDSAAEARDGPQAGGRESSVRW